MTGRLSFSHYDDMEIWRFVIRNFPWNATRRRAEGWRIFKAETGSFRSVGTLHHRFSKSLLPHLPQTKFHTETKLKLCKDSQFPVDDNFLEVLKKDAEVYLGANRIVIGYKMNANCSRNVDLEVDDEDFMELTSPIVRILRPFFPVEDVQIWNHLIENLDHYVVGERFWEEVAQKLQRRRTIVCMRFKLCLAPKLHRIYSNIETKLEIYKKCEIPVERHYLEILKNHAELTVGEDGCVKFYKLKEKNMKIKGENHEKEEGFVAIDDDFHDEGDQIDTDASFFEGNSEETDFTVDRDRTLESSSSPGDQSISEHISTSPFSSFMKPKHFTHEDDMAIWKFAIENRDGADKSVWRKFQTTSGTERTARALYYRFAEVLLPHLPRTKFHTEIKLKLCREYDFPVYEDFLEQLERDADIKLDIDQIVTDYKIKDTCAPNTDMELDDVEFMKLTSPILRARKHFRAEEDEMIWNYLIENLNTYVSGDLFWRGVSRKMERHPHTLLKRFAMYLAPTLPTMNLDVETKLKIYKKCNFPVEDDFLEILKTHAELTTREDGVITSFKMKTTRSPEKRKVLDERIFEAKKLKSDLVVDYEVPGTGIPNPEFVLGPVKEEIEDDLQELNSSEVGQSRAQLAVVKEEIDEDPGELQENFGIFPLKEELEVPMEHYQWSDCHVNPTVPPPDSCQIVSIEPGTTISEGNFGNVDGIIAGMEQTTKQIMDSVTNMTESMSKRVEVALKHAGVDHVEPNSVILPQINEHDEVPNMNTYLSDLQNFVSRLKSPATEGIQQRIDAAIRNLPDQPLPIHSILTMLDVGLTMIGQ